MLSSSSHSNSSKARPMQLVQLTSKVSRGTLLVPQVKPMPSQLRQATHNLLRAVTSNRSKHSSTPLLRNIRSMRPNLLPRRPRHTSSLPSRLQLSTNPSTPHLQLQHLLEAPPPNMPLLLQLSNTVHSTPQPQHSQLPSNTGRASSTSTLQVQHLVQASSTLLVLLLLLLPLLVLPTHLLHKLVGMEAPPALALIMQLRPRGSTAAPSSSPNSSSTAAVLTVAQAQQQQQLQEGMAGLLLGSTALPGQCTPQAIRAPSKTQAGPLQIRGGTITSHPHTSTVLAAIGGAAAASTTAALAARERSAQVAMGIVILGGTEAEIRVTVPETPAMATGVVGMEGAGTPVVVVLLLGRLLGTPGVGLLGPEVGVLHLGLILQRGLMGLCPPHLLWIG
jgi:hypothetical protein